MSKRLKLEGLSMPEWQTGLQVPKAGVANKAYNLLTLSRRNAYNILSAGCNIMPTAFLGPSCKQGSISSWTTQFLVAQNIYAYKVHTFQDHRGPTHSTEVPVTVHGVTDNAP